MTASAKVTGLPLKLALLLGSLCLAGCVHTQPPPPSVKVVAEQGCKAKSKSPGCRKKTAAKPKPRQKLKARSRKKAAPSFASWRLRLSDPAEGKRAGVRRDAGNPIRWIAAPGDQEESAQNAARPARSVSQP